MWKCPSLCDESQIQNPNPQLCIVDNTEYIVYTCPLCGKELMMSFICTERRLAGFLVSPATDTTQQLDAPRQGEQEDTNDQSS